MYSLDGNLNIDCLNPAVYFVFFSYCIYVVLLSAQWGGPSGIEAWSLGPLFLQCFDTVGWVFLPIKPVPDMTYNVFGGTLNLDQLQLSYHAYRTTCNHSMASTMAKACP